MFEYLVSFERGSILVDLRDEIPVRVQKQMAGLERSAKTVRLCGTDEPAVRADNARPRALSSSIRA